MGENEEGDERGREMRRKNGEKSLVGLGGPAANGCYPLASAEDSYIIACLMLFGSVVPQFPYQDELGSINSNRGAGNITLLVKNICLVAHECQARPTNEAMNTSVWLGRPQAK